MDVTVVGEYPVKYRHIKPAHGKTFDFTYRPLGPPQQLTHIGTTDCAISVGIYLSIDGARCFVAHINAFVKVPTPQGWDKCEQDILREEAISIEKQVFQKLTEVSKRDGWTAEDVVDYSSLTGRNPVIVCAEVFTAETRPAQFVARGESKGFVVDHATGQVDYVFSSVKGRDERRLFEQVEEKSGVEEWEASVWRREGSERGR
ncbi:hypothetical protein PRZ48_000051 [Zasmidium cellare]|uniref:Uncharacterized protein n=1 Tax=Zasmidium cellare TaxID=395010 RepID=A0ABR0EYS6_ZASCE|nr:hypothetical protein PRZ48_000051 [Zasmidium cellare]